MNKLPLSILITEKADRDEENVYKYIARKFGSQYAEKFREKVIRLFKVLATHPLSGRPAKKDRTLRVFVLNRQNKIVYKATEKELVIIRILNTKTKMAKKY